MSEPGAAKASTNPAAKSTGLSEEVPAEAPVPPTPQKPVGAPTSETQVIPSSVETPLAVPAPAPAGLEAEEDDWENDSAVGESIASSTTSLNSSIMKYREENGRTYHAYKDGNYHFPNDEVENDRLDLQHHLLCLTFGGNLFTAPIPAYQTIHRVLDIGTGTGIWAIDYADAHPEAHVLGVDLSPIQPASIPPNVSFEVDDLEETWTFSQKFDFIFGRMLVGGISNFPRLFEQAFENLNPGGWVEFQDCTLPVHCDDGTLAEDAPLRQWSSLMMEGTAKVGGGADTALHYKRYLEEKGFINVTQTIYAWPQNRWPKNKKFKELGMWHLENLCGGLEGVSLALFTRVLGWSKEETDVFLTTVRKDMKDTKIHAYYNVYVVTAQKPL